MADLAGLLEINGGRATPRPTPLAAIVMAMQNHAASAGAERQWKINDYFLRNYQILSTRSASEVYKATLTINRHETGCRADLQKRVSR